LNYLIDDLSIRPVLQLRDPWSVVTSHRSVSPPWFVKCCYITQVRVSSVIREVLFHHTGPCLLCDSWSVDTSHRSVSPLWFVKCCYITQVRVSSVIREVLLHHTGPCLLRDSWSVVTSHRSVSSPWFVKCCYIPQVRVSSVTVKVTATVCLDTFVYHGCIDNLEITKMLNIEHRAKKCCQTGTALNKHARFLRVLLLDVIWVIKQLHISTCSCVQNK